MGKASRTKRERRTSSAAVVAHNRPRRQLPVFWIVLGVIVLGAGAALVLTRPSDEEARAVAETKDAPAFADVTVTGDALPAFEHAADDAAVGAQLPTLTATSFDTKPLTVGPATGAQVLVVVAHWCPHCQAEVPRIVDWAEAGKLPAGVTITAVSTAASEDQPNFPPAAWLATERWPYDTLVDDEVGTAASALGVEGFPFIVFVHEDGTISERFSGEMEIEEFEAAVQRIAP